MAARLSDDVAAAPVPELPELLEGGRSAVVLPRLSESEDEEPSFSGGESCRPDEWPESPLSLAACMARFEWPLATSLLCRSPRRAAIAFGQVSAADNASAESEDEFSYELVSRSPCEPEPLRTPEAEADELPPSRL